MGRRLGELTANDTKCMVRLGGVPIIDRMISQIISNGINKITLVVGYKADHLIEHLSGRFPGVEIGFIRNTIYDKTNNIYSLSLAKDLLMVPLAGKGPADGRRYDTAGVGSGI